MPGRLPTGNISRGPPGLRFKSQKAYLVNPDVTVALTGLSATASAGSLNLNTSAKLGGLAATGAAGTLAAGTTLGLSGIAATSAVGALAPGAAVGLTGIEAASASGTLVPSAAAALSGLPAAGTIGSLAPGTTVGLTGIAVTVAQGTVSVSGDKTVALTGLSATASAGTLTASVPNATDTHDGDTFRDYRAGIKKLAEIAEERRRATTAEAREIRREILAVVADAEPRLGAIEVKQAYAAVKAALPVREPEKLTVAQVSSVRNLTEIRKAISELQAAIAYERMIDEDDEEWLALI